MADTIIWILVIRHGWALLGHLLRFCDVSRTVFFTLCLRVSLCVQVWCHYHNNKLSPSDSVVQRLLLMQQPRCGVGQEKKELREENTVFRKEFRENCMQPPGTRLSHCIILLIPQMFEQSSHGSVSCSAAVVSGFEAVVTIKNYVISFSVMNKNRHLSCLSCLHYLRPLTLICHGLV